MVSEPVLRLDLGKNKRTVKNLWQMTLLLCSVKASSKENDKQHSDCPCMRDWNADCRDRGNLAVQVEYGVI